MLWSQELVSYGNLAYTRWTREMDIRCSSRCCDSTSAISATKFGGSLRREGVKVQRQQKDWGTAYVMMDVSNCLERAVEELRIYLLWCLIVEELLCLGRTRLLPPNRKQGLPVLFTLTLDDPHARVPRFYPALTLIRSSLSLTYSQYLYFCRLFVVISSPVSTDPLSLHM